MNVLELCYAPPAWTGQTSSACHRSVLRMPLTPSSIKDKLRSGDIAVSGDPVAHIHLPRVSF